MVKLEFFSSSSRSSDGNSSLLSEGGSEFRSPRPPQSLQAMGVWSNSFPAQLKTLQYFADSVEQGLMPETISVAQK